MVWPGIVEPAIAAIEEAPFLDAKQKRAILHDNAARFRDHALCRAEPEHASTCHPRAHVTAGESGHDSDCVERMPHGDRQLLVIEALLNRIEQHRELQHESAERRASARDQESDQQRVERVAGRQGLGREARLRRCVGSASGRASAAILRCAQDDTLSRGPPQSSAGSIPLVFPAQTNQRRKSP